MNLWSLLLSWFRPAPRPVAPPPAPPPPPVPAPAPGDPDRLVAQLNAARAKAGRPALVSSPAAAAAAQMQAHWQARRDRIGHDGPPGYPTVADRLAAQGIVNVACGEIAAEGSVADYTFGTAIGQWLQSPGHRAILLGDYTHAGAAMVEAPSGNRYATAVFYRFP